MSDIDLLIIQQAKYPMDMPTNVVRPDIPFAPHPKLFIAFALKGKLGTLNIKRQFKVHLLLLPLIYHTCSLEYVLVV